MPGRKEHKGADIAAAKKDFENCFFVNFISFSLEIFCLLIFFDLFFRETINADEPNKPVRRGRRGSFIGRLNVIRPRKPARINIAIEGMKLSSLNIRKREMKIRRKGIKGIIERYKIGNIKMKTGINSNIINKDAKEPYKVNTTASCPFPAFNSS